MSEIIEQAINKIQQEKNDKEITEQKAKTIKGSVVKTLVYFCSNEQFAQAVLDPDKHLAECLKSIVKDVGNMISDLEVYKRAAEYYIPGADVDFVLTMRIGDTNFITQHDGSQESRQKKAVDKNKEKQSQKKPKKKSSSAEETPGYIQYSMLDFLKEGPQ